MDAQTRVLFVILVLLITAFAIHKLHCMHEAWEAEKRERLRRLIRPPEALVKVYMRRHWPGWSCKWDYDGTMLRVYRTWKNKHQMHLIAPKDIKL